MSECRCSPVPNHPDWLALDPQCEIHGNEYSQAVEEVGGAAQDTEKQ